MKRRDFILTETLAGAAMLASAQGAFSGPDPSVVERLSGYSDRVAMNQAGGEVRILASIDNVDAYLDPDVQSRALPYDHIRAEGNTLSFTHHGIHYTLENVFPEFFDSCAKNSKALTRVPSGFKL